MMKKYACLLLFSLLLNGCDDGDLTIESINFDNIAPVSCPTSDNTLLYKLKPQESFLLQLLKDGGVKNTPGTYTYDIDNSSYRVVFRSYDGAVAVDNICSLIPPSTPRVIDEWIATSGKIEISTTQQTDSTSYAKDGSTKVKGYNHDINFLNIIFNVPNTVPQTYPIFPFGTLKSSVSIPATLAFTTPEVAKKCPNNKQVYNFAPSFYIMIDNIDADLLVDAATPAGKPRQGVISATTNKVYYRSVTKDTGSLSAGYFCNATVPTIPTIGEEWVAADGDLATNKGLIEVTTTETGGQFIHTIVLRGVKMTKGTGSFQLPTEFLLGRLE